jgi:hypothetical protein
MPPPLSRAVLSSRRLAEKTVRALPPLPKLSV